MSESRSALAARAKVLVVGVGIAALVLAMSRVTGTRLDVQTMLIDMGFDPGRAVLLTALLLGALSGVLVAVVTGRPGLSIAIGSLSMLADDAAAFKTQTVRALRASDVGGTFDPIGWLLTGLAILVGAVVVAWAVTILALAVRGWLRHTWANSAQLIGQRHLDRQLLRAPILTVGVLAVLVAIGPVFGDLVNYGTDTRMRSGGPGPVALFGGPTPAASQPPQATGSGSPPPGPSGDPQATTPPPTLPPGAYPSGLVPGPAPASLVTPGALATSTPWLADIPKGNGRVVTSTLPGPWTNNSPATVQVYLPPGYDAQSSRRYPVLYEAPYGRATWDKGMDLTGTLDNLIRGGELPPSILVFAITSGGPFVDSECANSRDGREWFDRYVAQTLVPWVDSSFRTIPTAAARTAMGASKGGYCSAAILTHHPDLFANAISFSGYFVAGLASSQTIGSDLVFGRDPAYERQQSPIEVVKSIPASVRRNMFVVLQADPGGIPYGPQMLSFARTLDRLGIPQALLPTTLGHAWAAQRALIPVALRMIAARQVAQGVFGAT